jgi:hypothetical protein
MKNGIVFIALNSQEADGDGAVAKRLVNSRLYGQTRHGLHPAAANLEENVLLKRGVEVYVCHGGLGLSVTNLRGEDTGSIQLAFFILLFYCVCEQGGRGGGNATFAVLRRGDREEEGKGLRKLSDDVGT